MCIWGKPCSPYVIVNLFFRRSWDRSGRIVGNLTWSGLCSSSSTAHCELHSQSDVGLFVELDKHSVRLMPGSSHFESWLMMQLERKDLQDNDYQSGLDTTHWKIGRQSLRLRLCCRWFVGWFCGSTPSVGLEEHVCSTPTVGLD